uniref:Hydrolase n=1 Tax=Siphoviridae sp. ctKNZ79 TaxID=2825440 RepID=A0A8S5U9N7_9CAUD|nr:MAG TPA: hydrolase [Siphoviridae sp. ctKNZ79]
MRESAAWKEYTPFGRSGSPAIRASSEAREDSSIIKWVTSFQWDFTTEWEAEQEERRRKCEE